jgi:peptidoglycan/xylan/chitin deacetylase (PgdA/CDA1 family)
MLKGIVTEQADLAPGPAPLYPLKAAHTRLRSLLWLAHGARAPATPGFRILFYHRVSDDRDELAVTPRRFAVGLAFDDGYLDVAEHALPELERHGFTATVFVATGVTDGRVGLSWYREQPPLLSWDDVRRLDGGSLRFEAHTVSHPNLLAVGEERAREEIAVSKQELEERLGREVSAFCYPAGLYGDRDVRLVAEAGFRVACTCEPGVNTTHTDPLRLHRIQVDARDGLLDFRAKAGGGFDVPSRARAIWRRARYRASSRS